MAIEIRGFHDWIIHEDIASAVDAYLDAASTPAWRHRKLSKLAAAAESTESADADADVDADADADAAADGKPTAVAGAGGAEDQLEIVPVIASALPGDAWFEYCALGEGETLPEPGKRQDVAVKFR